MNDQIGPPIITGGLFNMVCSCSVNQSCDKRDKTFPSFFLKDLSLSSL